jgi:tetratricopeptide (TPR) repeat protein
MPKEKNKKQKSIKSRQVAGIGKFPTISACMMVKDEEELLPRCLDTIKSLVDEIVIVDTGSTDRTVEIAKSHGAKVYHHLWESDFSKHRNQSIRYASGDWIFIVDADEEVVRWDRKIDTILQNKNIDSVYVKVENIYGKGQGTAWHNSIRLFRNSHAIRYQGRVHNEIVGCRSTACSPIVIYHRGYFLDPKKEEEKHLRTKALLEREIEQDPDNPKLHHYLAVAYLGRQFYEKALEECKRALELTNSRDQDDILYLWTRFVGAVCCINTNRLDEAKSLCVEAIRNNPMHLDSYYLLCSLFYQRGDVECFLDHSDRYISLLNRLKRNAGEFGLMVHNTIQHEWRIRLHRGFSFTGQGEKAKANKEYSLALRVCRNKAEYHKERCRFSLKSSELKEAKRFLKNALEYDPESKELQEIKRELRRKMEGDRDPRKARGMKAQGRKENSEPTISLCMMIKDEEDFLPRCLDSVKDCVDEIVIVDTGSTDSSVQIAESYGAKIYHHPWEGDFSKHRNQSISYATKDWIFILDADEFLVPECGEVVREAVKDATIDSVYAVIKSAFDKGKGEALHNSLRIFKNNGIIHYEGRVHNRVVGEKKSKVHPITILHEGYNLSQEQSRRKFIRTTNLLKKEIEENPRHPRAYHYLAASYLSENMHDEAIEAAMKAITLAEEQNYQDFIYLWSHFIAGISYVKTNKVDEAEETCLRALHKSSKHLDSHYLLAIIYFDKGNWEKSLHHSAEYLALRERIQKAPGEFGPMVHNTVHHQWRIYLHRGFAFTELGKEEKANEAFSSALDLCDDKGEYYRLLPVFRLRRSEFSKAEEYLFEALKYSPEDAELYRSGAQIYQKLGNSGEERRFLLEVLERDPDDTESAFRLGILYLEEGSHSKAADLFRKVITRTPNHSGALVNLAVCTKKGGDLDGATRYLEMALRETPDSVDALSNLGHVYYDKGDLVKAQNVFERLITADPTLLDVHLFLAMIYLRTNKPELVVGACDSVMGLLRLDRNVTLNSLADLSNLFVDIGNVLLAQKRLALASLAFDVSIHLQTEQTQVLKKIGKICLNNESYNAGLKYLERAISLNPRDWESLQIMGDCYMKIGAPEAAALCRQKARELNPC